MIPASIEPTGAVFESDLQVMKAPNGAPSPWLASEGLEILLHRVGCFSANGFDSQRPKSHEIHAPNKPLGAGIGLPVPRRSRNWANCSRVSALVTVRC
jgi:hypothetical protein